MFRKEIQKPNNTIFIITAFCRNEYLRTTRTFGYLPTYREALLAVGRNDGDMHECLYDSLVIEEMPLGIHARSARRVYFEWNYNKNGWIPSNRLAKKFSNVINWAMG